MKQGFASKTRRPLLAVLLALVLGLVGPARTVRAEEPVESDLDLRIRVLEQERAKVKLAGPITGVALGAIALQLGLSQIISIQYNCPGYYDCSDETRWGLTGGAGALIVVGAATIAIVGPKLSQRLRARRDIGHEILDLRRQRAESASRPPAPAWALGFGFEDGRRDLRLSLRY